MCQRERERERDKGTGISICKVLLCYCVLSPFSYSVLYSTAQLLEPFCLDNEGRIASLNSEMGGSAPGMHSSMMHHTTTGGATGPSTTGLSGVPGTTGELEDPPGLYEKVK